MNSIYFENPTWLLVLCAIFGLILALLVYYRNDKLSEWSQGKKIALAVLRFITGFLLSALLLSPFLKSFVTETIKPTLLFAIDNSMSLTTDLDSTSRYNLINQLKSNISELNQDFETDIISFDREIIPGFDIDFKGKETDINQVIKHALDQYNPDNLGALVMLSDGIYNRGYNPGYDANKLACPIISIAVGDTIPKKDLSIKNVYHNKIAYLGDKFPIQCDVQAKNLNGNTSRMRLFKISNNGQRSEIYKTPIQIKSNNFFNTFDFSVSASTSGINHFRLAAEPINGEATNANNYKDIYIDVIDARQSILIYAASPHPDIGALKNSLETKKNYQTEIKYVGDNNILWNKYDLVIFHSLPNRIENLKTVVSKLNKRRTARLFVVGSQASLSNINSLQASVDIQGGGATFNNTTAVKAPVFNTFKVNNTWLNSLTTYPPLQSPFGRYQISPGATPLLYQKIGSIKTEYPLIALSKTNNIKEAVIIGEGLWRWRLFNYIQNNQHSDFDEFFTKIIQYLNIKDDKRRFRTSISKNVFNENEKIRIDAELYNKAYELINDPESFLSIKDGDGKEYEYTYTKTDDYYSLDIGTLPVGNYWVSSTTTYNGSRLLSKERFSVQPVQLELYKTTADHSLLNDLAITTNGHVIYPSQIDQLPDLIRNHKNIKPVLYQQSKTTPFLNLRWLLGLLILTLAIEWIARRYSGSY